MSVLKTNPWILIWEKLPFFIKWPMLITYIFVYLSYRLVMFGYQFPAHAQRLFDQRWEANAVSFKAQVNNDVKNVNNSIVLLREDLSESNEVLRQDFRENRKEISDIKTMLINMRND